MAVLKLLIELGWFDVFAICAVSICVLCKTVYRPKKPTKSLEISLDRRHKDKKKDPQEREDRNGAEKVLRSEEKTKNTELPSKSEISVNERKQNAETKGPQSASTDHSKVDDSKPAPQKPPSEKNVSDDLTPHTEANNNVSNPADSTENAGRISGQKKLKQFRDECLGVALFFDWCIQSLDKMSTNDRGANKSNLKNDIFVFLLEIEHQKDKITKHKISEHKTSSQMVTRTLNNFRNYFLIITEPANFVNMSLEQVLDISGNLTFLCLACNSLCKGFIKLANGAEDSFADGSDDRWKGLKKEIEADFKSATKSLEGIDKTNLFKIEEIVEGLNDEIQKFSGELLKIEE